MCLACIEYMQDQLTMNEWKRNAREFSNEVHDERAIQKFLTERFPDDRDEKRPESSSD